MLQFNQSASVCKGSVSNKSNSRSTSIRETTIILLNFGQTYARSEYSKYLWFKDLRFLFSKTLCRENHPTIQFWIRKKQTLSRRNSRKYCCKVQYSQYHHAKISISATSFLYQRGMGQHTSNKFEISEQFHPIPAFQHGETEFITKYEGSRETTCQGILPPEGTIRVQAGPKRCLLLCSFIKVIKEICTVSIGRDTLLVSLSFFGLGPAPLIFIIILRVPISLMKAFQILLIIYLDDVLLMSLEETRRVINKQRHDNFLAGSVINLKSPILAPVQRKEFIGLEMDFYKWNYFLLKER